MAGHRGHLHILSANVNSVRRKRPGLIHLLEETKPEVVCLQDTFTSAELTLPNYREVSSLPYVMGTTQGNKLMVRDGVAASEVAPIQGPGLEITGADIARPRQG